jgi:hypothetical protein
MTRRRRTSRILAVLAAYAVALQALLLPLSVAAGAPAAFSLCSSAQTGTSGPVGDRQGDHQGGCPCAAGCGMQCCTSGAIGPPQIGIVRAVTRSIPPTPARYSEPVRRPAGKGAQVPRGPPLA